MKYIKMFEDYNDYENKQITPQEWNELLRTRITFTDGESTKITSYIKPIDSKIEISYETEPNDSFSIKSFFLGKHQDKITSIKIKKSYSYIQIFKLPDDYYLVNILPNNTRQEFYYKCDDIQGTLNVIKDFLS